MYKMEPYVASLIGYRIIKIYYFNIIHHIFIFLIIEKLFYISIEHIAFFIFKTYIYQ